MGIIQDDLYRYNGKRDAFSMFKTYILTPGFRYSFWMRICALLRKRKILFFPLFFLSFLMLRHYQFKYGIQIPAATKIGKGFYIGHFSCIVISPLAVLGNNIRALLIITTLTIK